jgi:hypothetical protein
MRSNDCLYDLILKIIIRLTTVLYDHVLEIIIRSNDCFIRPYIGEYNEV